MLLRKWILAISSLIVLTIGFSSAAEAKRWNLLEGIDPNPSDFKEIEVGKKIVYWHQRKMDEAIVELDYIVYQFDKKTQELKDVKGHWREDLPLVLPELNITKEQAESMAEGMAQFSQLFIISPESDIFSPIQPTPKNPCWVVASFDEAEGIIITVIDAVEGKVLGYGVPPPSYTAFSLKGPQEQNPCYGDGYWDKYYKNEPNGALYWFDEMGYTTEANEWPTEEKVKSHIQSDTTAMFYEIAHSTYACGKAFASGCVDGECDEWTTADEIDDWISNYTKLPFAFIASCFGMCDVNEGTLSYAFRMGSERDTATVGYCEMSTEKCLYGQKESCWSFALKWQKRLFECMNDGNTVKEAFDLANADYPACFNPEEGRECMRFAGDPNFAVVPLVPRVPPFPSLTIVDDVNDDDCVWPWNFVEENYLTYTICYDGDGNDANNVIIVDQLPVEVDYNSSDSNGDYDSNSRTVTWEIGDISGADSNCVHLTVKVNQSAKPGSAFRNYCEIRNDQYSRNATEKTNVCCWGPDIIYVDANAGGYNNGTCWSDAYTDLQDGLTGASNCDGKDVIRVAGGTYKPAKHVWQEIATFQLVDGVDIYGGFPPGGGQRNPGAYETILTVDIAPDIDYVVTGADNAILDGFTITMGRRGIYCKDCNNLTVADCIISENISDANGGGIYCEDANNITIKDCIISENQTGVDGGGIYDSNSSSLTITNCTFSGNSAGDDGGGIYNDDSSPNISNCIFTGNTAADFGGGIGNFNQSSPTITNCIFTGNSADGVGAGGIGNAYQSSSTVRNCIFSGNSAGEYGGGMRNYQSSPTVTNCIFNGNSAGWGGGMQNHNESSPTVTNCSFSGNSAVWGGGMHNEQSSPTITNCIFWVNNADWEGNEIFNWGDSDPNVTYSDVQGTWSGEGNIDSDPLFYDPNDPNDYHLGPNSPCIDVGDPNFNPDPNETDIDGEPRIANGRVDMGADEYYWSPADFNENEIVNFVDYAMFANAWQTDNPDFSLDDDNDVDMNDLSLFVEDWLWIAAWTQPVGSMMMGQGTGGGMSQSMGRSLGLAGGLYQAAPARQQPTEIKLLDMEEIIKWLDEIWLDPEVREVIDEDKWLKFMESIKEQI